MYSLRAELLLFQQLLEQVYTRTVPNSTLTRKPVFSKYTKGGINWSSKTLGPPQSWHGGGAGKVLSVISKGVPFQQYLYKQESG